MKRFLKKHFNRFLPDVVRSSIKRRAAARFLKADTSHVIEFEKTRDGLKCRIDGNIEFLAPLNCEHALAYYTSTEEGHAEVDSILQSAKTGGVLFDIGAHSGLVSVLFCAVNPQNVAFSFEPSPLLVERIAAIRDLNQFRDRIRIEQCGIGEKNATVEMAFDPIGGFVQAQRFEHSMWAAPEPIAVKIESISDAAARLKTVPQFLKIDIEGYEFEAIKGSLEFIAQHRPTILLELHLNYLEQRQLSAKSLVTMLTAAGYGFFTSGGTPLGSSEVYDSPLPIVRIVARG